jgi:anaerobic selenocysteine-containing dehydrogenase
MVHNERGAVLVGAVVTERIIPGALSIDHGAKIDLATLNGKPIDRGGCINLISPSPMEKYGVGREIKIPEMNVSGFLAQAVRIDPAEIVAQTGARHGLTASS